MLEELHHFVVLGIASTILLIACTQGSRYRQLAGGHFVFDDGLYVVEPAIEEVTRAFHGDKSPGIIRG